MALATIYRGGSRTDACKTLAANYWMTASFSGALIEGLTGRMSDTVLAAPVKDLYVASTRKTQAAGVTVRVLS